MFISDSMFSSYQGILYLMLYKLFKYSILNVHSGIKLQCIIGMLIDLL